MPPIHRRPAPLTAPFRRRPSHRLEVARDGAPLSGHAGGAVGHHPRGFPVAGEHHGGSRRAAAGELSTPSGWARNAVQPPSDSRPNRYSKRGDVSSSAWSTVKMGCSPFRSSVHWRCNWTYSHNLRLKPLLCFHLVKFDATAIHSSHLGRFPTCRHWFLCRSQTLSTFPFR